MGIPTQEEIEIPLLFYLSEYINTELKPLYDKLSKYFELTSAELNRRYPHTGSGIFYNRVRWARKNLIISEDAESQGRDCLSITKKGRSLLKKLKVFKLCSTYKEDIEQQELKEKIGQNRDILVNLIYNEFLPKVNLEFFVKILRSIIKSFEDPKDDDPNQDSNKRYINLDIKKSEKDTIIGQILTSENNIDCYIKFINKDIIDRDFSRFLGDLKKQKTENGILISSSTICDHVKYRANNDLNSKSITLIDGKYLSKILVVKEIGVKKTKEYFLKEIDNIFWSTNENK